jgi:drug/metabolite transporter (DMT)-like permease
MDAEHKKAYLLYHICVFLWGFTAVFGKIIQLEETLLVWYRMGITVVILLAIPALWKGFRALNLKIVMQLAGIGALVTIHWITFYGSIKAANISVALTCLATSSFMVSILEPILFRKKFIWYELLLAIIVIPAIYLVFRFSGDYKEGIILGLVSALFATIFSLFNKKMITKAAPLNIAFVEIGIGFLLMCILMPFYINAHPELVLQPSVNDIVYLVLLAGLCTVVPFTLSLYCLKYISVFTASITLNLEPVYGILMAIFFFNENEYLQPGFYVGTLLILTVVFINPFIQRKFGPASKPPLVIGE